MAHVEGICRGAPARVQVKWLFVLVRIQDLLQVSLAEENAASNKTMRSFADGLLKSSNQLRGDWEASILLDEFVIVDASIVLSFDLPGSDSVSAISSDWLFNFFHHFLICSVFSRL